MFERSGRTGRMPVPQHRHAKVQLSAANWQPLLGVLETPEGQVLCQSCIMAVQQGSGTRSAPVRGDLPSSHDWEGDPLVVGDRPKTAADYWRDAQAGAPAERDAAPTGGILGFLSEPIVQEYRPEH